jgi:hypothetical protein
MSDILTFAAAARLPAPGDNTAIAIRRIDAGTRVEINGTPVQLPHTVLEGHRFAVRPLAVGETLLSWGMPFGTALRSIAPGDYVTNQSMLDALAIRRVEVAVFPTANFADRLEPFTLNEATFQPAPPVEPAPLTRTFQGYRRPGHRGVGTRNVIVILGTTSRTAAFARRLAARLQPLARINPGLDGIVAIAHTEGGGPGEPNNVQEVLRALAGFMVHPNVAAVLAVDFGVEPISNARLRGFMTVQGYALDAVPHAFLSLTQGLAAGLAEGERIVRDWLPAAAAAPPHAGADFRPPHRAAVRWLRRVFRRLRQPAGGCARTRGDPPWRHRCDDRDRRSHRRRSLPVAPRARSRDGQVSAGLHRAFPRAPALARHHTGKQSIGRQPLPRLVQHRDQVARRRAQEGPAGSARLRHRVRGDHSANPGSTS